VTFKLVRNVADLDRELAQASSAGKSTMLDFYADWCTSCKEMEKYSFSTADVQTALKGTVLLQADVTANSDDDQALLHRFGIFGPPTIAFFGTDGAERKNFRVVGFMPAEKFRDHVRQALGAEQVAAAH
jgi:thiol:disulfide interchange protein DsbD